MEVIDPRRAELEAFVERFTPSFKAAIRKADRRLMGPRLARKVEEAKKRFVEDYMKNM